MESFEAESMESAVLTVGQLIDVCLSPFHIDVSLLHALLNIISSKLNLHSVRIHIGSPTFTQNVNSAASKSKEIFEAYRVVDGGTKKPFKLTHTKLEKIEIDSDPPVDSVYKLKKIHENVKDFHRVSFPVQTSVVQPISPLAEGSGDATLAYTDLLNIVKRLEACEISLEKFSHLVQRLNQNQKDLQRSFSELHSTELAKPAKDTNTANLSERYSQTESRQYSKSNESEMSKHELENDTKKDVAYLQEKFRVIVERMNDLYSETDELRCSMKFLQEQNEILKKSIEKSADGEKLKHCSKEICNLQKKTAHFTDKISDLISYSNQTNLRFKDISAQLKDLSFIRVNQQKIQDLENSTQNIFAEFELFTERLQQLKVIKADREEVDYICQCKVDKQQLENYVTMDLFNSIRVDLSNGLFQAFEQIMATQLKCKESGEKISIKVDEKMEKSEKDMLTKFVNEKINSLYEKFRDVLGARVDVRSAATRTRALKDANCICCASEADIVCDTPVLPKLPPVRHIRKICQEPPELPQRYCGGSHTVISPQQKVTQRKSLPMYAQVNTDSPDLKQGKNGMMYRVSKPECICENPEFPKIMYPSEKIDEKVVDNKPKLN